MMRPLLLDDPEVLATIKQLIEKAAARPTPYAEAKRLAEKKAQGMDINPMNDDLTMTIPVGYRVTYTHEHQREDLVCRHISVSAENAAPNKGPSPQAVVEILKMFGFKNSLGHMPGWVSKKEDGSLIIELVEPLDGDLSKLRGA